MKNLSLLEFVCRKCEMIAIRQIESSTAILQQFSFIHPPRKSPHPPAAAQPNRSEQHKGNSPEVSPADVLQPIDSAPALQFMSPDARNKKPPGQIVWAVERSLGPQPEGFESR
jgi:hypothetical protein